MPGMSNKSLATVLKCSLSRSVKRKFTPITPWGTLLKLFRKRVTFEWSEECQHSMDLLKRCLTSTSVLVPLDYSPSASIIVVSVDASTTIGWGAILQQDHGAGLL